MHKALISAGLLLIGFGLRADTAEDYFHRGAQRYVFDEPDKARVEVKIGLAQYPDDPKLKKLAKLLKLDEEDQQASKQQKQDQKQPEEKPDSSKQDQNQDEAKQKEDKEKDAPGGDQQKDQAKQDKQEDKSQGDEQSGSQGETNQVQAVPGQMTPQQAQQLLDSQKGQEKALIFVPAKRNESKNRVFKDW